MRYPAVILRSFLDFLRDDGLMLAGSISFFTMTALVPFCLFLVTLFGYLLGENRDFYQFFLSKLVGFFPKITSEITEELKRIITHKGIGKFSLGLYSVISFGLFSTVETSINTIFRTREKRRFIVSLILSVVVVTCVMSALFIAFATASAVSMLKHMREFFPGFEPGRLAAFLLRFVVPLLLVFLIVMILYWFLPRKKVRLRHALSGALFTALFLDAAKHLFTLYVVKVAGLGTIYGPLSAFVIFLLWVFYSSCIFLIGAEMVRNLGVSKGGNT